MSFRPTRRSVTAGLALGALASPGFGILSARAQEKSVKMAMIAPLSGPWARQGQLLRQGADMAIDEINRTGGIKSLGGAKFELVVADAGDSTEKAKNAAQRLLGRAARSDRRLRLVAQLVHAGRHRGHRAGAAAVADPVLFRRDHQSRLQIHFPDVADRRLAGRADPADDARPRREGDRQAAENGRASYRTIPPRRSVSASICAREAGSKKPGSSQSSTKSSPRRCRTRRRWSARSARQSRISC